MSNGLTRPRSSAISRTRGRTSSPSSLMQVIESSWLMRPSFAQRNRIPGRVSSSHTHSLDNLVRSSHDQGAFADLILDRRSHQLRDADAVNARLPIAVTGRAEPQRIFITAALVADPEELLGVLQR